MKEEEGKAHIISRLSHTDICMSSRSDDGKRLVVRCSCRLVGNDTGLSGTEPPLTTKPEGVAKKSARPKKEDKENDRLVII